MRQDIETPSIAELFSRYLDNRIQSGEAPEQDSEVVLHDAGPVQPVEPRLAWDEAIAAIQMSGPKASLPPLSAVTDWRALVAAQEPALDLAFCAGNFPQMVRNLSLLLSEGDKVPQSRKFESASLVNWAEQTTRKPAPQALLAAGVLRLAHEFERASRLLADCASALPKEWKAAWQNEQAALAWHSGRREEALGLWQDIEGDHLPALFNRGMANLFLGKPAEAAVSLKQAIARLPESSSWHHLARLYLTLAEMRQ
jgi:tetratricopeptide (TPR) repeat protein